MDEGAWLETFCSACFLRVRVAGPFGPEVSWETRDRGDAAPPFVHRQSGCSETIIAERTFLAPERSYDIACARHGHHRPRDVARLSDATLTRKVRAHLSAVMSSNFVGTLEAGIERRKPAAREFEARNSRSMEPVLGGHANAPCLHYRFGERSMGAKRSNGDVRAARRAGTSPDLSRRRPTA